MFEGNYEVQEVMDLGVDYWDNLVSMVESNGVNVYPVVKLIVAQMQNGLTPTPKQAAVLMNFKTKFGL